MQRLRTRPRPALVELEPRDVPATFFVSPTGNDNADGLSAGTAWKSFDRVFFGPTGFPSKFQPGDVIQFEGGGTFTGQLSFGPFNMVTSPNNPVTIQSYGTGKATLRADTIGSQPSVLTFYDLGGVTVQNLNVIGPGPGVGNFYHGINFVDRTDDLGSTTDRYRGITVNNIDAGGYSGSAIHFFAPKDSEGPQNLLGYGDIKITNSSVHDSREGGITFPFRIVPGYFPFSNVLIDHVTTFNNAGSPGETNGFGLSLGGLDGAIVQRSVIRDNGSLSGNATTGGGSGIVVLVSNNVTIQFNEVYNSKTNVNDPNAKLDGNGIDLDFGAQNSVVQYNYTHDNFGAGIAVLGFSPIGSPAPNMGNVVRFNVTQNNGRRNPFGEINVFGKVQGVDIYNNTVFVAPNGVEGQTALRLLNDKQKTSYDNVRVFNNVFTVTGGLPVMIIDAGNNNSLPTLNGNTYANVGGSKFFFFYTGLTFTDLGAFRNATGKERLGSGAGATDTGFQGDPGLNAAGTGGNINNADQLTGLSQYRLKADAAAGGRGIDIQALFGIDAGGIDFYEQSLPVPNSPYKTLNAGADQAFIRGPVVTASPPPPPAPIGKAALPPKPTLAGGPGNGSALVFNPSASGQYTSGDTIAFPGLTGAVRTAIADLNGDGVDDFIGGSSPGQSAQVVVIDGASRQVLATFRPFGDGYSGGVFVAATAKTANGIQPYLAVSPDQPGVGPRVQIYPGGGLGGGTTAPQLGASFLGLASLNGEADTSFLGGGRVGINDVNGDGVPDLVVGAGNTGGPRITVWDGNGFPNANGGQPTINPIANLFVFENTQRDGAFVTAGDVTGDGKADMAFGGGPGGGPRIRVVNGAQLLALPNLEAVNLDDSANLASGLVLNNFFSGDVNSRGGIRVALRNADNDNLADLVTGSGDGQLSVIRVYTGNALAAVRGPANDGKEPTSIQDPINAFGVNLDTGVFVG